MAGQYRRSGRSAPSSLRKLRLEDGIAAVDDEAVAGMEARGVRGEVDGDAREVLRLAPAPHRHAADRLLIELIPGLQARGHVGADPARQDRVRAYAVARVLDGDAADHCDHRALGRSIGLVARRTVDRGCG